MAFLHSTKSRAYLAIAFALLFAIGFVAWKGYGNPFQQVTLSGAYENYDPTQAFFVAGCQPNGSCELVPEHERLLHFSYGDGVQGHPGEIEGRGGNPIALLTQLGLSFIPAPDYAISALKWCSSGPIWQEFRTHGRHFIVPLTDDPLSTAKCVRDHIPRPFDVFIADPMLRDLDRRPFAKLIEP